MPVKKFFSFIPHYCLQCNKEIHLDPKRLGRYEKLGYPEYHSGHEKKNFKKEQGDFSFLPHYCKCGCHGLITLSKKRIMLYEHGGYPEYILGHSSRIFQKNQSVYGDFEYIIKCYCKCPCKQQIPLSKRQIHGYEKDGYPEYIKGHKHKIHHPLSIAQGDFEYIPYKCLCGCGNFIKLKKKNFARYEHEGYPKFIKGHNGGCPSDEARKNMSDAQVIANSDPERKKKQSEIMKGNQLFKGHKQSPTWIRNMTGENHPRWNGGAVSKYRRRKNNFKWNPLNPVIGSGRIIKGYDRHHVNFEDFIYVPHDYNQIIYHNLNTGYHMNIVNTMAYFFLIMNHIEDLNKIFIE